MTFDSPPATRSTVPTDDAELAGPPLGDHGYRLQPGLTTGELAWPFDSSGRTRWRRSSWTDPKRGTPWMVPLRGRRSQGARDRTRAQTRAGWRWPHGTEPSDLHQADHRRRRGLRGGGRARAGADVRSARGGGDSDLRCLLPAVGRAAARRWHGASPPPD